MTINHHVELISVKWAMYFAVGFRNWAMCFLSFSASLCLSDNLKNLSVAYITNHKSTQSYVCTVLETLQGFKQKTKKQGFSCKRVKFLLSLRSLSAEHSQDLSQGSSFLNSASIGNGSGEGKYKATRTVQATWSLLLLLFLQ